MIVLIATILSIIGYIFVARKNVIGFYIWIPSNVLWMIHFYAIKEIGAFILFTFYTLTTFYGIAEWKKNGGL